MQKCSRKIPNTLAVSLVMLASELVGYLRDLTVANYFGTSAPSDAFIAASGLLMLPMMMFAACLTSAFIPLYMQMRISQGPGPAARFASNTMSAFTLLATLLSLIIFAFARPLAAVMNPGFERDRLELTAQLARIMLPSLGFVVLAMALSTLLEAHGRFVAGQMHTFPRNLTVIAAAALFARCWGIQALAWACFAASFLQAAALLPFSRDCFHYTPTLDGRDPQLGRLMRLSLPTLAGMGISELNHLVNRAIASSMNVGDVTAMSCAMQITTLATGVLAAPVTTVMFPRMSQRAAQGDARAVARIVLECTELLALALLPVIAVGAVLHDDVIALAFGRGEFGAQSVRVTAGIFLMQLPGLLAMGLRGLYTSAFHALQDMHTPLKITCVMIAVNVALSLWLAGPLGVRGLALANSATALLSCALLFGLLRRSLAFEGGLASLEELLKLGVAAALCAQTALALNHLMPTCAGGGPLLGRTALVTLGAAGTYLVVLRLLSSRTLETVTRRLCPPKR